jgi:hypothetical protein
MNLTPLSLLPQPQTKHRDSTSSSSTSTGTTKITLYRLYKHWHLSPHESFSPQKNKKRRYNHLIIHSIKIMMSAQQCLIASSTSSFQCVCCILSPARTAVWPRHGASREHFIYHVEACWSELFCQCTPMLSSGRGRNQWYNLISVLYMCSWNPIFLCAMNPWNCRLSMTMRASDRWHPHSEAASSPVGYKAQWQGVYVTWAPSAEVAYTLVFGRSG